MSEQASTAIDPQTMPAYRPQLKTSLTTSDIITIDDLLDKSTSLDTDDHYLRSLREGLGAFVRPGKTETNPLEELENFAVQWIILGLAMLHLYIPSFPLDPYSPSKSLQGYLSITHDDIQKEIHIHSCAEALLTGNSSNLVTKRLEARLEEIQRRLVHLPQTKESARAIGEIHAMMAEFVHFHQQILDIARITALVQAIKNGEADAAPREAVLQDSCLKFSERIKARYPELGDLSYPVIAWVERLRLGFRLLRDSLHLRNIQDRENANSFIGAICSFPTTVGMSTVSSRQLVPPSGIQPKDWSSICAYAIIFQLKGGSPIEKYRFTIWNVFEQMFGAWLADRSRREQEEQAKATIYKQHKHVEEQRTDEELEQAEFRALFPEFDDILASDQQQPPERRDTITELPPPHLMFQHLFSFQPQRPFTPSPLPNLPLANWASRISEKLDFTLDASSVFFRLRHVHGAETELSAVPSLRSHYNFYVHHNLPELGKALVVVNDLQTRLSELAKRWPEQMVLKHLGERCQAVLNLDLHSSLAKILSTLEQLLLHSDDWQKFADRENSIQDHQQAIGNLIIEWRRLELSCWAHLLDNQALTFSNDISNWWFLLYESVVRTSMAQSFDPSENLAFLKQFLPFLETFLAKSPIGQFSSRLNLLKDFGAYLSLLTTVHPFSSALNRTFTLLMSVVGLYDRFTSKVTSALAQRRKDLDKEVQSFIKLASWKDVNVLALKASAQRTHHQLYKLIRKFRTTLEEPVTPLLAEAPAVESTSTRDLPQQYFADFPNTLANPPDLTSFAEIPNHLRRLGYTLSTFSEILQNEASKAAQLPAESVEEFSTIILSRINELQNAVPPTGIKNNEKWYKNLHARKRKAFSDLIKACKEHGLTVSPKPFIMASQNERLWLLERRNPLPSTSTNSQKMDAYFDSIIGSVSKLHGILSSHSDDISTRDLTKLTALGHSTLSLALEAQE
jgi:midasin